MKIDKIKPCPHCGKELVLNEVGTYYYHDKTGCYNDCIAVSNTLIELKRWNTRFGEWNPL